MVHLLSGTMFL